MRLSLKKKMLLLYLNNIISKIKGKMYANIMRAYRTLQSYHYVIDITAM